MSNLSEEFARLKADGRNTVKDIVIWMKRAKVINANFTEKQAKKIIAAKDDVKVDFAHFKEIMKKICTEQKQGWADIVSAMKEGARELCQDIGAGISAIKHNIKPK